MFGLLLSTAFIIFHFVISVLFLTHETNTFGLLFYIFTLYCAAVTFRGLKNTKSVLVRVLTCRRGGTELP